MAIRIEFIDAHVNAGDIVTFRVYGYSLYASGEISLYLKNESVYHLSATGGEVIASQGIPIAGGVWKKFELVDVEIPYSGSLDFRIKNNSSHAEVYFDDIHIEVYTPSSGEYSVIQRDDYYPFGLTFNSSAGSPKNNYLYNNGSELQPEWNAYMTDYRTYAPDLGRWMQVDPISKFHESGYAWVTNNPIRFNDPLGLDSTKTIILPKPVIVTASRLPRTGIITQLFGAHIMGKGADQSPFGLVRALNMLPSIDFGFLSDLFNRPSTREVPKNPWDKIKDANKAIEKVKEVDKQVEDMKRGWQEKIEEISEEIKPDHLKKKVSEYPLDPGAVLNGADAAGMSPLESNPDSLVVRTNWKNGVQDKIDTFRIN
jgi:RHS repeat-associated protein